jgi:hypothetical protein
MALIYNNKYVQYLKYIVRMYVFTFFKIESIILNTYCVCTAYIHIMYVLYCTHTYGVPAVYNPLSSYDTFI